MEESGREGLEFFFLLKGGTGTIQTRHPLPPLSLPQVGVLGNLEDYSLLIPSLKRGGTAKPWRYFGVPDIDPDLTGVLVGQQPLFTDEPCASWSKRAEVKAAMMRGLRAREHLHRPSHVVGKFNSHLLTTLLLFADEAFFAGDAGDAAVLKAMITESERMAEAKGVDAFAVKNCLNIIAATNNDWVCPAERSDRRYCVMNVNSSRRCDTAYFKALADEMNGSGPAALMHHLKSRDVSAFRARNFPQGCEAERWNQKGQSMPSEHTWWLDCLESATLPGNKEFSDESENVVERASCFDALRTGPDCKEAAARVESQVL